MKALSILGCGSGAGKSWITTAFCAWLRDQGVRVAPFKAQNMSNNAWVTLDGGEIGRAQAVQSEACGLTPTVQMNPILLKPSGSQGSQLIVLGQSQGHCAAAEYYRHFDRLWQTVTEVLDGWRERCDVLMMEGAGSPVELNLLSRDLVNLRPCRYLDGRWVFVGDIDRGGIFAQLAGVWALLSPADRARGLGAIVNRFRGDLALFTDPQHWLEPHAPGFAVLGTLPYAPKLQPEEEDGLSSDDRTRGTGDLMAWVRFPHVSNLTDCQPWWTDQGVQVRWTDRAEELLDARVIVLPGSKNTLADLRWLRASGMADAIVAASRRGALIIGVCGGFQMLGLSLEDPSGVESAGVPRTMPGLGQLPVRTIMRDKKTVRPAAGRALLWGGFSFSGYEIHMGETLYENGAEPFAEILRECEPQPILDGAVALSGRVWGTYIHGLFDDDAFRHRFLHCARQTCGLTPARSHMWVTAERNARIDRWAGHLRQSLDMNLIHELTNKSWASSI